MRFAVPRRIDIQDLVQHGARIILIVVDTGTERDHIARCNQGRILALYHFSIKDLLLLVRDDGSDGDAVPDIIHIGRRWVDAEVLYHF